MSSGFNDLIDPDGLLATVLRLRSQEYSRSGRFANRIRLRGNAHLLGGQTGELR